MIICDGIGPSYIGAVFMTGGKSERLCRCEKWATSPAKWDKCPIRSNTVFCWLPEEYEWRQGTRSSEGKKKSVKSV